MPLSARHKHWDVLPAAPADFIRRIGYSPLLATLLYQRQLREPELVQQFLRADYRSGLHNPMLLKGMPAASERIAQAIQAGEPIAVYGDFDTDGVTAVTLLVQALGAMGAKIQPYIPHRTREGYGLNLHAVQHLAANGVRLLITVDCGISNHDEVAEAMRLGMDVIVTDHHTPPSELPPAYAIVNPKQPGCTYPYPHLVGVGVAFKLVQALVKRGLSLGDLRGRDLLDVVALGTVADMGPLDGENRVLVKAGLEALNATQRPGLRALVEVSGLSMGKVDSAAIGYMLAPRINAAGRLDDAVRAYELLLATSYSQAKVLANELNQTNRARQDLTKQVQAAAKALAEAEGRHQQLVVVLHSPEFDAGVVGLVAGKLAEEWGRPVLLIEQGEASSRGSARSIPGFSIIAALQACHDLFERYGGHSAAAGFTIPNEHIPTLDARLQALAAAQLSDTMLQPRIQVDAEVGLNELSWELLADLAQLEPFGQANPQPILMSRSVQVVEVRSRGADGQHLSLIMRKDGGPRYEAIAFRLGHLADALRRHPRIDLIYTLEANEWNGERKLQINIKDFRRAS
ncbi:single-stranded-DNA-specific exonuclease RecJ [Oscillochloris trichoides DG-6]|uniref:Single-stranded-DNA-specific exonuclease RecJ n=1 Tax=Oscillochloris trichoides DG-6 TaxID=765420 RepID=E1IH56_9CHLR|nr:single-stranded-DNA-specific exonuclease RecJ [Oscillochloris trichoides]EFO79531.1 single-stranded-DNA-specific exonuclease RecJ [Oscillochloris trichoides DG-6]